MIYDSLRKLLPASIAEKLERLAELDERTRPQLLLLDLCAYVVSEVAEAAALLPLENIDDVSSFTFEALDLATLSIGQRLALLWPRDPQGQPLAFIEEHDYRLSEHYAERKARAIAAGKYRLLLRISTRIAREHAGRPDQAPGSQ